MIIGKGTSFQVVDYHSMGLSTMDLLYHGEYHGANYVTHTDSTYQGCIFLYRVQMCEKTVGQILTDSLDNEGSERERERER